MKKYKIEDLFIACIVQEKFEPHGHYKTHYEVVKRSGKRKCFVFSTKKSLKIYSKYSLIEPNEQVVIDLIPLLFKLEIKKVKTITLNDILYIDEQIYLGFQENFKIREIPRNDKINVSNEFFLKLKKVIDEIDSNVKEELKKEYLSKLSNIGNEYINCIIENYSSIRLNPSLELEILKKYFEELNNLEQEIIKQKCRKSKLIELKKYINKR